MYCLLIITKDLNAPETAPKVRKPRNRKPRRDPEAKEGEEGNSEPRAPRERKARGPQECWSFRDNGSCTYNEACRFSHGEGDTRDLSDNARKDRKPNLSLYLSPSQHTNINVYIFLIFLLFPFLLTLCFILFLCLDIYSYHVHDNSFNSLSLLSLFWLLLSLLGAGPCYIFRDSGDCKYGDNCRFSHNPDITE